jgi:hypothetical protein
MTATTQGLAGPGLVTGIPASQGMYGPGFGSIAPGFPSAIGPEQFFGVPSPYGVQAQLGHQQPQLATFGNVAAIQQVAAQVAPIAQQVILPQVIAVAMQQVQQQLPQLIAHLSWPMTSQQIGQWPSTPGWQQPATALFGQVRPYAYG